MAKFSYLIKILMWLSALALIAGFYKPWIVLWWKDTANRKRVLFYYGVPLLLFFILLKLLQATD